jgi:hypothetical protein
MAAVNKKRVWLGTVIGGVIWTAWSFFIHTVVLGSYYSTAMNEGTILKQSRYPLFLAYWIVTLFLLTYILIWIYLSMRVTLGPGPLTAFRVAFLVGFAMAFPLSLSVAAVVPFSRVIALGWMCDLWAGAVLATMFGAWVYRD